LAKVVDDDVHLLGRGEETSVIMEEEQPFCKMKLTQQETVQVGPAP
jgi:hypothetical protein